MSEEKKDEIKEPEQAPEKTKEEEQPAMVEPEKPSMIEEHRAVAERIEKGNAEHERLLLKEEKMLAEKALGGRTDAGSKAMSEDEKVIEGAKRLLKGTGYETMFDESAS